MTQTHLVGHIRHMTKAQTMTRAWTAPLACVIVGLGAQPNAC